MSCLRYTIPTLILASVTVLPHADAQISFTVNRQNGVVTGGGILVNGIVTNGGMYVRMGVNANASQLIGVQNFNLLNGATTMVPAPMAVTAVSTRQTIPPRPSAGLFAKTAWRFDSDENCKLDKKELTAIAAAVTKELQRRPGKSAQVVAASKTVPPAASASKEVVDAFVTRCLTFDKDEDQSLNESETRRMAAAFIRSLK